jgi:hypothetical protein
MAGDRVWDAWREGRIGEIRDYCETDVLNTYLIYLRFELVRGHLSAKAHEKEVERAREWLGERSEAHWRRFLAAWQAA